MTDRKNPVVLTAMPFWPMAQDRRVARIEGILKTAGTEPPDPGAAIDVSFIGSDGAPTDEPTLRLEISRIPDLTGPAWRGFRSARFDYGTGVAVARLSVAGFSAEAIRSAEPLILTPLAPDAGLSDEPVYWWRFTNTGPRAVATHDVLSGLDLVVDGRASRLPMPPYNGPAHVPPGLALQGILRRLDLVAAGAGPAGEARLAAAGAVSAPARLPGATA